MQTLHYTKYLRLKLWCWALQLQGNRNGINCIYIQIENFHKNFLLVSYDKQYWNYVDN